jgi:hypothetical protein
MNIRWGKDPLYLSTSSFKQHPINRELRNIHDVRYYAHCGPNLSKLCATCLSFEFLISVYPLGGFAGLKHKHMSTLIFSQLQPMFWSILVFWSFYKIPWLPNIWFWETQDTKYLNLPLQPAVVFSHSNLVPGTSHLASVNQKYFCHRNQHRPPANW